MFRKITILVRPHLAKQTLWTPQGNRVNGGVDRMNVMRIGQGHLGDFARRQPNVPMSASATGATPRDSTIVLHPGRHGKLTCRDDPAPGDSRPASWGAAFGAWWRSEAKEA